MHRQEVAGLTTDRDAQYYETAANLGDTGLSHSHS
jgi:hypothetical protein